MKDKKKTQDNKKVHNWKKHQLHKMPAATLRRLIIEMEELYWVGLCWLYLEPWFTYWRDKGCIHYGT